MTFTTPPLLTGIHKLDAGEGVVINFYQGIRLTMIPVGGNVTYSKIDDPEIVPPVHDPTTQLTITAETVVDVDWPFYYVTCDTGTARVALV